MKNLLTIFIFLFIGLSSCKDKKSSTSVVKPVQSSTYDTLVCYFDTLSPDSKRNYINRYKGELSQRLISNYDKYATVVNVDSIFEILISCDFSSRANKALVPFYIHVLTEILKNRHVDGYVGESLVDVCYSLLSNFPGCFYQYMNLADKETKETLMDYIFNGLYLNDINKEEADSVFKQHIQNLPNLKRNILELKEYIWNRNFEEI